MENMANNNWKITCLHYGTLSCYKSLFDGGLDQTRYPFVYSGYLLQKDGRNILVDTGVHQDNIVDGKAWADSPAEGGNQFVLDSSILIQCFCQSDTSSDSDMRNPASGQKKMKR